MKLKAVQTEHHNQPQHKPARILDPNFKYVSAAATDITQTWRKFGWVPIERKERFKDIK